MTRRRRASLFRRGRSSSRARGRGPVSMSGTRWRVQDERGHHYSGADPKRGEVFNQFLAAGHHFNGRDCGIHARPCVSRRAAPSAWSRVSRNDAFSDAVSSYQ
jgi:hypothetical protein